MKLYSDLKALADLWMDSVARTLLMGRNRFLTARPLRLVEQDDGAFRVEPAAASDTSIKLGEASLPDDVSALIKGKRTELVLKPHHFLFRPLELPRRAGEFLDGIVRAQIDRLTPWAVKDALFGCTRPVDIGNDRIALTVAATARGLVRPYVDVLTENGARSVFVSTRHETSDATAEPITIIDQAAGGGADLPRLRRFALAALLIAIATTAFIAAGTSFITANIDDEQIEVARRISAQRDAMRAGRDVPTALEAAQRGLEQRKRETPSNVLVIEALSRILPNDTYLTELRITGDKLQVVGMSRDAPTLIPLIEQSAHFDHATFFAPTTQAQNDPRENFHIETKIQPVFTPAP